MKKRSLALVFPPLSSPTYAPLGITTLASFIQRCSPETKLRVIDLNLELWSERTSANGALHAFYRGDVRQEADSTDTASLLRVDRSVFIDPAGKVGNGGLNEYRNSFFVQREYLSNQNELSKIQSEFVRLSEQLKIYLEKNELTPECGLVLDRQIRKIGIGEYDVLGISMMYPEQFVFAIALAKFAKTARADLDIVIGGAMTGAFYLDDLLKACRYVDAVVLGEGEYPVLDIVNGKEYSEIPGVGCLVAGAVSCNRHRTILGGDSFTGAEFNVLKMEAYFNPTPVLPVFASRGCLWRRCRFCAHNSTFGAFRYKRVEQMVDELCFYQNSLGCEHFYFVDQYVDEGMLSDLCDEILRRRICCFFHVMARGVREYTDNLLEKAFAAGCRWISWGIESGSQFLLDQSRKGIEPALAASVIRRSGEVGISNLLMMIFGLPGSTQACLDETFEFIDSVYPHIDAMTNSSFVLFENTPFGRKPERYGLIPLRNQTLVEIDGQPIRSFRLDFKREGEHGEWPSPLANEEVDKWRRRRAWMGGELFMETLGAEHYLLYAAGKAKDQSTPIKPSPENRTKRLKRVS